MATDSPANFSQIIQRLSIDLHASTEEVAGMIQDGSILLGKPTSTADGHRLLYQKSEAINDVFISGKAYFKYCDGREVYDLIKHSPGSGIARYMRFRQRYNQMFVEQSLARGKFESMKPYDYFGRRLVDRAHFGRLVPTTIELAETVYRKILNTEIKAHFSSDNDVLIELGSCQGVGLMDLYLELGCPDIPVIGCDISNWGNRCLAELSKCLGFNAVTSRSFDLSNPELSFASQYSRPLLFSIGALVYAKPSISALIDELTDKIRHFDCVFLEPISYELADYFGIQALFPRKRAIQYGFNLDMFAQLKNAESRGKVVIRDVVPDFIGATPFSALSLVRIGSP